MKVAYSLRGKISVLKLVKLIEKQPAFTPECYYMHEKAETYVNIGVFQQVLVPKRHIYENRLHVRIII